MFRFIKNTNNCAHLFGLQPARGHIALIDVEDAYQIARTIPEPRHREAMYAYFGMDMQRVETLYPQLRKLEAVWQDPQQTKMVFEIFGKWRITIDNIPPSV